MSVYSPAEMDRMKLEVEYDQLKHQLSPVHQGSNCKSLLSISTQYFFVYSRCF